MEQAHQPATNNHVNRYERLGTCRSLISGIGITSTMAVAHSMVGLSNGARTPEGLQRISEANLKHGRQTEDKLAAQRHAAEVGRRVMGELKRLERQLFDAGLMLD